MYWSSTAHVVAMTVPGITMDNTLQAAATPCASGSGVAGGGTGGGKHPMVPLPLRLHIANGSCACCKLSVRVAASNHLYDKLLTRAGPDAFLLEALFRNETWGFMLQPVSQANEDAICQSMVDGCRHVSK